jgi:hypothetical protein
LGQSTAFCPRKSFLDPSERISVKQSTQAAVYHPREKNRVKKKSTWVSSHWLFYHFWVFYEYTETLGAFFVDFLKSILSNKRRTKTEKTQRKIKSGKNSILELFYMYPIFGGFATQKIYTWIEVD